MKSIQLVLFFLLIPFALSLLFYFSWRTSSLTTKESTDLSIEMMGKNLEKERVLNAKEKLLSERESRLLELQEKLKGEVEEFKQYKNEFEKFMSEKLKVEPTEVNVGPTEVEPTIQPTEGKESSNPAPLHQITGDDSSKAIVLNQQISLPVQKKIEEGFQIGTKIKIQGVYTGNEFSIQIRDILDDVVYFMNVKPAEKVIIQNDFYGGYGKEFPLPIELGTNEEFFLEIEITKDQVFQITLNEEILGDQQTQFKYRSSLPLSSIRKFSLLCSSLTECMNIKELKMEGLPNENLDFQKFLEKKLTGPTKVKLTEEDLMAKEILLFIGVMSSAEYYGKRDGIRKAWFQDPNIVQGRVVAKFFVGKSKSEEVNKNVIEENEKYGDMVLMDLEENYFSIPEKTLQIMEYGSKKMKPRFVMKCDDDTFVRVDRVVGLIENETRLVALGFISFHSRPIRDKSSKWYITEEEFSAPEYPPFCHGPGYILSIDIAKFVTAEKDENKLPHFKLEDVSMGIWLDHAIKVHRMPIHYVHNQNFLLGGCSENAVIGHYINPPQMVCMYENVRLGKPNFCC